MSTPPLCPLCDEHDCDCEDTKPAAALPVPEATNAEMVQKLTMVFAVSLDGFLERYNGEVSHTDLLAAIRNMFVQVASVCSVERLPEEPMAAYANYVAILECLDHMRAYVAAWNVPRPPSITVH